MFDSTLRILTDLLPFIIAIAGSLMSYRRLSDKLHTTATVLLIAFGICGSIVSSVYHYRVDRAHDREVSQVRDETQKNFARILEQQQKGFDSTVRGLEKVIKEGNRQFNSTMSRTNVVLTSITGGTSYAVVLPVVPHLNIDGSVPLAIENHGAQTLTGVTVTVYAEGIWVPFTHSSIMQSVNQRVNIGSLHAGEREVMSLSVIPQNLHTMDAVNGKIPRCLIYITQQNYTIEETLDFTKDSAGNWMYRYKAYRQPPTVNREGKIRAAEEGVIVEAADWSSDVNQPKRTTAATAALWH